MHFMADRRTLLKMGGALTAAASMSGGAEAAPSPSCPVVDPMSLVDPELLPAAEQILKNMAGYPPLTREALPQIRAKSDTMAAKPRDDVPWEERMVPGMPGQPQVRVFVINAQTGARRPGIVFIHGGGFVLGDAKATVPNLQDLAVALDCGIISVDYRLAPETTYRGSIEDNYAGLRWMHANAAELGVDPKRIAIVGESAGGGHAALLAITARDRGEVPVVLQMLIYPMLDDRTGITHPVPSYVGKITWTEEANKFGWHAFLGQEPGTRSVPTRAVPARVTDLCGLPPAFIGVGTLDLFANEDMDYAHRLMAAAVPTELHVFPGAFHGFDYDRTAGVSKRFNEMKRVALARAFGIKYPA